METMTFGEYVRLGACHGGYVIGLLAALGLFALTGFLIITLVGYLMMDKEDKR